ncbi:hypothetical protein HOLleu_29058 [Holothuria leucospilota]|uniref:Uncharacterized protein n=1 Tax=Holothuria leucospilota TaxID=206669 RepID=A0A9Q1BN38_HOLLE|nr:hypothetical protein HOLleu_29058 [Holothuria leucospilota]
MLASLFFWCTLTIFNMATGTLIIKVEPFDPDLEKWESYEERTIQFFLANDVTEDKKKVAVLLSSMGPKGYGEKVRVLDFRKHTGKWSQGVVSKVLGPVTYLVCVDNQFWKRHIDQIRSMHQTDPTVPCPMPDGKALGEVEGPDTASDLDVEVPVGSPRNEREHNSDTVMPTETHSKAEDQNVQTEAASSPIVVPAPVTPVKPSVSAPDPGTLVLRRSTRIRKPRVMLDL